MHAIAAGVRLLETFTDAWNAHDVVRLMRHMTDDCRFFAAAGPDDRGAMFRGREEVERGYRAIFERFPDARWDDATHVVCGDRGFSEWTFRGTAADGQAVETRGCDLFLLRDGLIAVKDSFRKQRS